MSVSDCLCVSVFVCVHRIIERAAKLTGSAGKHRATNNIVFAFYNIGSRHQETNPCLHTACRQDAGMTPRTSKGVTQKKRGNFFADGNTIAIISVKSAAQLTSSTGKHHTDH